MPDILILNPNDQPTGKWRLINELRECLKCDDFDTLLITVAFAKTGPLYRLQSEIQAWRKKKRKIEAIFGINHCGTSSQALEFAVENFSKARLLHFDERHTFHPKMYLFTGPKRCRFYIGSHKLTVGGTETNWESGTRIDLALPADDAICQETITIWDSLVSLSLDLTPALLKHYNDAGDLLDETKRQRRDRREGGKAPPPALPPGVERPKLIFKPPSALPSGLFLKPKTTLPKAPGSIRKKAMPVVPTEALVIQVLPHHNNEVLLSMIAVKQNPEFFGWPFSGHTTPKKPQNPSYPQRTPDPIVNLTIYGAGGVPLVQMPKIAVNTVVYERKSEFRITLPSEAVENTPPYSILVMRQAPSEEDYDYDFEIFRPDDPQFASHLAVCNQTLPSGGKETARKMGWL